MTKTISLIVLLAGLPLTVLARSTGAPVGRAGAEIDGGQTCGACHRTTAVNSGPGKITVSAVNYVPGERQNLTIRIEDPAGLRWGYQLTARIKSDPGKQAGTFSVDVETRVRCGPVTLPEAQTPDAPCKGELEFASHTQAATRAGTPNAAVFNVDWTAPATNVGDVIFYVAGNAANNNNANSGDNIYTSSLTILAVAAKPQVPAQGAVLNAASLLPGISPNSWFSIFGVELAGSARIWGPSDFSGNQLPKALDGVSVNVNGKAAYIYSVSPGQITALAPGDTARGNVAIEVVRGGLKSDPVTAVLQAVSPAFFVFSNGSYATATHADGTFVGPTNLYPGSSTPAKPGEVIALFGTGFGATNPAIPEGLTVSGVLTPVTRPTIRLGSLTAEVQFAGLTAAGLFQFNVKVPDQTPDGDIALIADVGGVSSPTGVAVRVQR